MRADSALLPAARVFAPPFACPALPPSRPPLQVDIDSPHPELLNQLKERHHEIELPAYRSTGVANASTPPTQRFVWLLVNVPAPHLIANGLRLAQWDPDVDALKEKQGRRRGRGGGEDAG